MVLRAIAKENNIDIENVETDPGQGLSAEYKKLNPLGRVPTFEAPNGWVLSEVIAIAIYCMLPFFTFLTPKQTQDESYYYIQLSLS